MDPADADKLAAKAAWQLGVAAGHPYRDDMLQVARLAIWLHGHKTEPYFLARNAIASELRRLNHWRAGQKASVVFVPFDKALHDQPCSDETPDRWLEAKQRLQTFEARFPGWARSLVDSGEMPRQQTLREAGAKHGVSESRAHQIRAQF